MPLKVKSEKDFISAFNPGNGFYIRSGILENGKDTGVDPFMASFPELLDVGIMGHCIHGKSGFCIKAGIQCYQDGLHSTNENMNLEDFESICEHCEGKTFQIAFGGCGDPDMHEEFEKILKCCRKHDIVPNFTTSGLGMSPEKAKLCNKYCGAVAVSWYRSDYTLNAIQMLLDAGVKTNIHYVLANNTIEEAVDRLETNDFPEGINAVVFLLHKPVGLGERENCITLKDPRLERFLSLIDDREHPFKVGFDSCTVPLLINQASNIGPDSLDTCEGARWSAYITPDMQMLPCSFDNQDKRWSVDLKQHSIQDAWNSKTFDDFRSHFITSCPKCEKRHSCMGGCPIVPEIVLCKEKDGN